jgi:hypothetical protein
MAINQSKPDDIPAQAATKPPGGDEQPVNLVRPKIIPLSLKVLFSGMRDLEHRYFPILSAKLAASMMQTSPCDGGSATTAQKRISCYYLGNAMYLSSENLLVKQPVGLADGWLAGQIVQGTGFGLIGDMVIGIARRLHRRLVDASPWY